MAFDGILLHGKGHCACRGPEQSDYFRGNTAIANSWRIGWTAGAGPEPALISGRQNRIRLTGFQLVTAEFHYPLLGAVTSNASLNVPELKAGVNFRFAGP